MKSGSWIEKDKYYLWDMYCIHPFHFSLQIFFWFASWDILLKWLSQEMNHKSEAWNEKDKYHTYISHIMGEIRMVGRVPTGFLYIYLVWTVSPVSGFRQCFQFCLTIYCVSDVTHVSFQGLNPNHANFQGLNLNMNFSGGRQFEQY
jgi:hypothetical protein